MKHLNETHTWFDIKNTFIKKTGTYTREEAKNAFHAGVPINKIYKPLTDEYVCYIGQTPSDDRKKFKKYFLNKPNIHIYFTPWNRKFLLETNGKILCEFNELLPILNSNCIIFVDYMRHNDKLYYYSIGDCEKGEIILKTKADQVIRYINSNNIVAVTNPDGNGVQYYNISKREYVRDGNVIFETSSISDFYGEYCPLRKYFLDERISKYTILKNDGTFPFTDKNGKALWEEFIGITKKDTYFRFGKKYYDLKNNKELFDFSKFSNVGSLQYNWTYCYQSKTETFQLIDKNGNLYNNGERFEKVSTNCIDKRFRYMLITRNENEYNIFDTKKGIMIFALWAESIKIYNGIASITFYKDGYAVLNTNDNIETIEEDIKTINDKYH